MIEANSVSAQQNLGAIKSTQKVTKIRPPKVQRLLEKDEYILFFNQTLPKKYVFLLKQKYILYSFYFISGHPLLLQWKTSNFLIHYLLFLLGKNNILNSNYFFYICTDEYSF